MPRKKNIELGIITIPDLTNALVEKNDCLGVKLVFKNPFTAEQRTDLIKQYKVSFDDTGMELSRSVNNSWKGLVMFMIALGYFKERASVKRKMFDHIEKVKHIRKKSDSSRTGRWDLLLDYFFDELLTTEETNNIAWECMLALPPDELAEYYKSPEQRAKLKKKENENRNKEYKRLVMEYSKERKAYYKQLLDNGDLEKIRREKFIEAIPPPDGMRPCYIKGLFESRDIIGEIDVFASILNIDFQKSKIKIEPSKPETLPHTYKVFPATCDISTIRAPYGDNK